MLEWRVVAPLSATLSIHGSSLGIGRTSGLEKKSILPGTAMYTLPLARLA